MCLGLRNPQGTGLIELQLRNSKGTFFIAHFVINLPRVSFFFSDPVEYSLTAMKRQRTGDDQSEAPPAKKPNGTVCHKCPIQETLSY